ncbi:MAG: uroporphyrinogen decarboxylase family protein [Candidatus Syntropharchaeia archaeon]
MTPKERIDAVLGGEEPDRVPVLFMAMMACAREGGYTMKEYATNGEKLGRAQIAFYERYKPDCLAPGTDISMTASSFGSKTEFHEGMNLPTISQYAVNEPEDWEKLEVPHPKKAGRRGVYLTAVEMISKKLGDEVPIFGYIITPLTLSSWVGPLKRVVVDMKKHPDLLHKGLRTLTEAVKMRAQSSIEAGISYFIMVTTRATRDVFTEAQYREFGMPYDLDVLKEVRAKDIPVIVHLCGVDPFLDMIANEYPVHGINWWDRGPDTPNLREIKEKYGEKITLVGGIDQTRTLIMGKPEDVEREAKEAIKEAAPGGGFILAPGCDLPPVAPPENIKAVVEAAKKYGRYPLNV